MHPSRKPYRFLSRSFPGRLPMLSASLMVSLALTGCAGGDDAATSGTPKSTALAGFVFDQIPGEVPHILASEPPEHESTDALAEAPSIADTLSAGPLMLAQTEPAHVMVDQFGNILCRSAISERRPSPCGPGVRPPGRAPIGPARHVPAPAGKGPEAAARP